jgi:hypothetical protein
MSYRFSRLQLLILTFLSFVEAGRANAGWWHHHCSSCGTYSTTYHSAAAPAAAPAVAMAPAYYLYGAPVSSAPAQGLVSSLSEIASVVKLIQELRSGLGNVNVGNTGTPGTTVNTSTDGSAISEALGRIEAGQNDLRGRMINNAGILQSIGERLGDKGPIMLKLDSLKVTSPPSPGNDISPTGTDAGKSSSVDFVKKSELDALRTDIAHQLSEISTKLDKFDPNKTNSSPPKPPTK